jgi:hypothetical protein
MDASERTTADTGGGFSSARYDGVVFGAEFKFASAGSGLEFRSGATFRYAGWCGTELESCPAKRDGGSGGSGACGKFGTDTEYGGGAGVFAGNYHRDSVHSA